MKTNDSFDERLSAWLRDTAEHRVPGHLDEVLVVTAETRQRPWWSSPERWLPMDTTFSGRLAPAFRPAWILILVAVLLLATIAIAVLLAGSQRRLPPPYGPAENGVLLYADRGDIVAMTPDGRRNVVITGSTNDSVPTFSRDGSKFAFLRATSVPERSALMLASADGSDVRELTARIDEPSSGAWSPDGSHIALASRIDDKLSVWTLDVATGAVQVVATGMRAEKLAWTPDGRELVFRGETVGQVPVTDGLYRVGVDGRGLRPILYPSTSDEWYQEPALSPDGKRVIYTQWDGDEYPGGHLYVVGTGGGTSERLWFTAGNNSESDYFAAWSPDGGKIVFNRGTAQDSYHLAVGAAGGGAVIDIGPELPWDVAAIADFSPDGKKVIARYGNGQTWIFDVDGGPGQLLDFATPDLMVWQRLAP